MKVWPVIDSTHDQIAGVFSSSEAATKWVHDRYTKALVKVAYTWPNAENGIEVDALLEPVKQEGK